MVKQNNLEDKDIEEKARRTRPFAYTFRATEEEKKLIDNKQKQSGLSMTDFIIRSITDKPVIVVDGSGEILAELKRQGKIISQTGYRLCKVKRRL